MPNQANIKAVITAEDRASGTLKNFGDKADGMSQKLKTAFNVAGVAAVAFGAVSVKAFTESQDLIAQTNAVLKSTGQIAGVTADEVDKLSKSLQKVTKYSDEDVRSVENLLLTFTSIDKKIFPQATKTVLDMATALGEDTKSASIQLGKALQDPILGITALRRVGVNFSAAQKDVVKKLVETGRKAEAQKLILKELQTEFGGSAEAAGKTFSGQLEILKNQLNDVQEQVGSLILNALQPLIKLFSEHPALVQAVVLAVLALATAFVTLRTAMLIGDIITAAGIAIQFVGGAAVTTTGAVQGLTVATLAAAAPWAALAIAASAAAILIVRAANDAKRAWDGASQAASSFGSSQDAVIQKTINLYKSGKITKEQEIKLLNSYASNADSLVKRASGGPVTSGQSYMVGEQGPEMFTPNQGGKIVPNNKLGGANINVTFSGIFTGNKQEFRKLAVEVFRAHEDAKGMGTY